MRPVTDHLNSKFLEVLSNDSEQSNDEHMEKAKDRSGMKHYIKSKPIKWGFKFWICCSNQSGYLYQIDIYLEGKQTTRVQSRSLGRRIPPADERLGAIVLHCLFWQLFQ